MTSSHRTRPGAADLPLEQTSAWKIAEFAAAPAAVPAETQVMVINRIIDNAAVSAAAVRRHPVTVARAQARAHPTAPGARIFGLDGTYSPEWAAFANGIAVHQLELHDVFPAAEQAHPGANIPALVAVAQHAGLPGTDLVNGIATAYEVHIALARQFSRQQQVTDQRRHAGIAVVAGLGTMLRLSPEAIHAAITHTLVMTAVIGTSPQKSNWPNCEDGISAGYIGKFAIEAVDRAMHGERHRTPEPDTENNGYDWLLGEHPHPVRLPEPGEPTVAILDSYPRAHPADYLGQALIDLARRMRRQIRELDTIESIVLHTGHQAHLALGSGAGDPRKFDPAAPRESLCRSAMYIFAVTLQDGAWHHDRSYAPARPLRPDTVELWQKISTAEHPEWTDSECTDLHFGARATITMTSGDVIIDELGVADAHPLGDRPFQRRDYIAKFTELADGVIDRREQQRFLDVVTCLSDLRRGTLSMLNPIVNSNILADSPVSHGIFR